MMCALFAETYGCVLVGATAKKRPNSPVATIKIALDRAGGVERALEGPFFETTERSYDINRPS